MGDSVEVAVADTGVGISPKTSHRIMEPLYSTKARGLGLGLAIARAILEKNKGSLARDQRTRPGQHLHRAARRGRRQGGDTHHEIRRHAPSWSWTTTWTPAATCPTS